MQPQGHVTGMALVYYFSGVRAFYKADAVLRFTFWTDAVLMQEAAPRGLSWLLSLITTKFLR